ncbi:MAG: GGDEF domain-containing protein [Bacillus sp. (in: Bacteria)]|nr:GGDEF domain-containing protein [Bacillus sp. (in: firmicutes)]MCM1425927.1 GGDEF domain-containing protein [Eubacterium sp.]
MMKKYKDIKQFAISKMQTDKFQYKLIIYAITMVHVMLVCIFTALKVWPLILFNIGSVITYLRCIHIIKYGYEKELIRTFYITYLEIILHSFVATIFVGWQFGFTQYIVGLVPFGYFMCVNLIHNNKRYVIPTILGLFAIFAFISCRMIYMFAGSVYHLDVPPGVELAIYIFNALCNFGFLFLVTLVFLMEIQAAANQLRTQNAALDNMASIDPLTGLYNRRSMQDYFDEALRNEEEFSLVMCDIDNFKKVNDTYGHDFGDVVLKDITQIISNEVGDDGHVCRWGGEEILILCHVPLDKTCRIAENIRSHVEEHLFTWSETSIHCSLTLGIASHRYGNTVEDTITHADRRLYYGKHNGKNRVVSPFDAP